MFRPLMWKRLYLGAVLLSVAFLSFLYGVWTTSLATGPYRWLRKPLVAARALHGKWNHRGKYSWYFYGKARSERTGVTRHDPERAYAGLTLFSSGHSQKAYLVDMAGQLVHEWHVPFYRAWPEPRQLGGERPPSEHISVRMTHLYPNGDLIALYAHGGGTPWGCGLVKMSRSSSVIWTYDEQVHHDLQVAANGQIYTIAHAIIADRGPSLPRGIEPPVIEDYVVVLSAEGREIERLGLLEAFGNSEFSGVLEMGLSNLPGDLWHANSVFPLEPHLASAFPQFQPGQVLVSVRAIDALAVLDLGRRSVVWVTRGPWYQQHDAEFLPDGRLLLFDNLGLFGPGGDRQFGPGSRSRVLEIDPTDLGIVWQHAGTATEPLYTHRAGSQQRLPNGNTLISEFSAGRIVEVTRDHQVAWEYHSPFRAPHDRQRVGMMYGAQRFAPEALSFERSGRRPD